MTSRLVRRLVCAAVMAGLAMAEGVMQAPAAVKNWIGGTSAYWNVGSNWGATPAVPVTGDSLRFNPASSSQLSPINNMSGLSVISVRLGDPLTGNGGFNVTGGSITATQNFATLYTFSNYGDNTWGVDTWSSTDVATVVQSNTAGKTLTFSGQVHNAGQNWVFDGPGNVVFTQVVKGADPVPMPGQPGIFQIVNGDLEKSGTGKVTLAYDPNQQVVLGYGGGGRVDNFDNFKVHAGEVEMGNWIGSARQGGESVILIASGGTVTVKGPLTMPGANSIQHGGPANVIRGISGEGTGVLRVRGGTSGAQATSRSVPDFGGPFFRTDYCGGLIETGVDLGDRVLDKPMRYVTLWALGMPRSDSEGYSSGTRSREELTFQGSLSGSAGLSVDVEPTYWTNEKWGRAPVEGTVGLKGSNTAWTGDLEIYSGNVVLKHASALASSNNVSFIAPDSLHTAGLYLNGNSATIGNLSGTSVGKARLYNGGITSVTLTVNQTTDATFNGVIANGRDQGFTGGPGFIWGGQLGLVKQGAATLTLGGTNYYSGGTTLSAGTLKLANPKALGDSTGSLVVNAGTLDINGQAGVAVGTLSGGGQITNNSTRAASLNTAVSGTATFSGVITDGTSALAFGKSGAGSLTLTTGNTYTGGTTLTGGALQLDFTAGGAPLANILPNGTLLTLGGSTLELFGAGSTVNTQTVGNLTFTPGGSTLSVYPGSGGSMTLTAGNTWTRQAGSALQVVLPLSGGTLAASPTVSGGVVVGSGSTAFAVVSTGGITDWATVSGGRVAALGTYANNGYGAGQNTNVTTLNPTPAAFTTGTLAFRTAQANTVTLTGTNTLSLGGLLVGDQVGANVTTISGGSLTSGSNELVVHQYNTDALGTLNLDSQLVNNGSNPLLLVKAGPGKLVLGNAGNSFTGGTVVDGGTLVVGAAGALGLTTNPLTVANGTLDLGGNGLMVGSLSGGLGTIANNGSAATLTVNSSANTSFGGTLANGTGALALTKSGSGTLVLSGTNTHTGGTSITGGVLSVGQDASLGAAGGTVSLDGGTLKITSGIGKAFASTNKTLTWGSGGATLDIADPENVFTITQTLDATVGQGDLVKTGPGTLRIGGANASTYTGATKVLGGTLLLDYTVQSPMQDIANPKLGPGALVLGGATLAMFDNGQGAYAESYARYGAPEHTAGLTLEAGDSVVQTLMYSSVSVGNITRKVGGTINAEGGLTTTSGDPSQILGGWAVKSAFLGHQDKTALVNDNYWDVEFAVGGGTAGGNLATFNTYGGTAAGSGTIQPDVSLWAAGQDVTNAYVAPTYGDYTPPPSTSGFSGSLAADLAINTLRILPAQANTVNLGGNKLEVSSGGILVTFNSQNNGSYLSQITGGTITAGNGNYGGDLIIHQYNTGVVWSQYSQVGGDLEIGAVVTNAADPTGKAGDTAIGSSTISGLASTADLYPGMPISGAGIPVGAKITAINDGTSITISAAATANGTATGLTIQSANGLTKSGPGRLILSGNNTYTGPTFLNNGTTWVNGNQSAANGAVTVAYGATLGGTGTLGGAVTVQDGGIVAPGTATPGTLNLANGLDMSAAESTGATMLWRLASLSTSGGFDAVDLTGGNLLLDGLSAVSLDFSLLAADLRPDAASPDSFWLRNETWRIIGLSSGATNTGGTNFTRLLNDTFANGTFRTYVGTGADSGSIYLQYTVASVPEPSTLALLSALGVLGLAGCARRMRASRHVPVE